MEQKCGSCKYFIQHYALLEDCFRPIYFGHCTKQKRKKVDQLTNACNEYIFGESVDDRMVTKRFLTKELLNKILSLDIWDEKS